MALYKDDAIVLRRLDYSETSQVLLLFCRAHGLQRLIAKGIKRGTRSRVAVGVDLLESGAVAFSRREGSTAGLGTLTEWRQRVRHDAAERGLAEWYAAQYAAEATAQLMEEADPHTTLFDALAGYLSPPQPAAPDPSPSTVARLVGYLLTLLREIGLLPLFDACAGCGGEIDPRQPVYFSSRQGGLLCRDCEPAALEKRRMRGDALPVLRAEPSADSDNAAPARAPLHAAPPIAADARAAAGLRPGAAHEAAFDVLDYHLAETLGRPLRLSGPLRDALGAYTRPARPR